MNINWSLVWEADPFVACHRSFSRDEYLMTKVALLYRMVTSNWCVVGTATCLWTRCQRLLFLNVCPGSWIWWQMQTEHRDELAQERLQWEYNRPAVLWPYQRAVLLLLRPALKPRARRRWGGFVREMLPEPLLPEAKFSRPVLPQMGYFGCSTWDCPEGSDFSEGAECPLPKMWSLEKQGIQICEDAVGIWISTSTLKSRTEPSVDNECLGAKSLLETTMLKVVTPERGTAPVLWCFAHQNQKWSMH